MCVEPRITRSGWICSNHVLYYNRVLSPIDCIATTSFQVHCLNEKRYRTKSLPQPKCYQTGQLPEKEIEISWSFFGGTDRCLAKNLTPKRSEHIESTSVATKRNASKTTKQSALRKQRKSGHSRPRRLAKPRIFAWHRSISFDHDPMAIIGSISLDVFLLHWLCHNNRHSNCCQSVVLLCVFS